MAKKTISRLSVLAVLIVFLAACSKTSEYTHVIPADASVVASINLKSLASKAGLDDKENEAAKQKVLEALKSYSKQIIGVRGRPVFVNLDILVFADRKWCVFIIGQIIANSVKYAKGDLILTFEGSSFENGRSLLISDNGIGIAEADLQRIFDKGFTGENGRNIRKSTGIGLYLCRKLCRKMNMEISAASSSENGTTIKIIFPYNLVM